MAEAGRTARRGKFMKTVNGGRGAKNRAKRITRDAVHEKNSCGTHFCRIDATCLGGKHVLDDRSSAFSHRPEQRVQRSSSARTGRLRPITTYSHPNERLLKRNS